MMKWYLIADLREELERLYKIEKKMKEIEMIINDDGTE